MQWLFKCLFIFLLFYNAVYGHANNYFHLTKQAQQGNAVAQYLVGFMYQQGKGVKADKKRAIDWYNKSAKQNYVVAQYALIAIYQYGDGVKPNAEQVNYWYQQASKPRSLSLLNTQQQDIIKIIQSLQQRAINNDITAQYLLANLYANSKQDETANYWFLKAAMAGDKDAQYYIGIAYHDKLGFFNKMQGIFWLEKAAQQNFLDAEVVLASIYEENHDIAPDYKKAAFWYLKAANQGDIKAQSFIAGMYRDGKGVTTNKELARVWFEKAAKQGDAFSQYNLGRMYETGNGVPLNIKKAIYWYTKGAKQGHTASELKLKSLQAKPL